MAKTESSKTIPSPVGQHIGRGLREAALLVLLALAGFLLMSLLTYDPADPGWSYTAPTAEIHNRGGVVGAFFADLSLYLLGYLAYLIPVLVAFVAGLIYRWQKEDGNIHWSVFGLRLAGFVITVVSGAAVATLHFEPVVGTVPLSSGGVVGSLVSDGLETAFSFLGATLLALAVFLAGVTVFTGLSWIRLMGPQRVVQADR